MTKRIMVNLPTPLVDEVERLIGCGNPIDQIINDALRYYLQELRRQELRNRLREGYAQMAALNRRLAEEEADGWEDLCVYEAKLASSD
ncbi:MAG: hypothetical protein ACOYD6_04665 [Limnochordia bacterium]|jgi:CopG family transcriptional regulator/antitoxin EndoAI